MKNHLLLTFFLLLHAQLGSAQCNLKEYSRIFKEANGLKEKGQFIEAKNRYEAAKIYACDQKALDAADGAVDKLFEQINQLRKQADSLALTGYTNDLVYKSTIALERGDRTSAFRLAEFAYRYLDPNNPSVRVALLQALYYNDNPDHVPLPWASNLKGLMASVASIALSQDGKKLAVGSTNNIVKIWDLESGKDMLTLSMPVPAEDHVIFMVSYVAFSPDGKKLVT
ncbi:MAG: hypothetical protein ABIQ93_01075, partial [Saprospiraceae bacterium]